MKGEKRALRLIEKKGWNMKKVLFVINSMGGGGAEKVALDMLNNLDPSKYQITLQTLTSGGLYESQLAPNIETKALVKVKNKFLKKVFQYLFLFIIPPRLTHRLFLDQDYDIEVAYLEGFPTKLVASGKTKAKRFAWVHIDLLSYDKNGKVYGSEEKAYKFYSAFDKVLCVSSDVKKSFIAKYGMEDKAFVQYNVINDYNIKELSKLEPEEPFSDDVFQMVSVGRLTDQKGYDRLLRVCGKLAREGEQFCLTLVGTGPDEATLRNLAQKELVADKVRFVGFQKNPYPYMKRGHLFVCSSRAEGFSTVATEAMILGTPILSTDCAGMHDLLGDNAYGIIVENNEEALYNGLKKVLNDPSILIGIRNSTEKRGNEFVMKKRIEEIEHLLDA